jgi:hypothetical protein
MPRKGTDVHAARAHGQHDGEPDAPAAAGDEHMLICQAIIRHHGHFAFSLRDELPDQLF